MKDYPDEQITILNNAFFHKKSHTVNNEINPPRNKPFRKFLSGQKI